MQSRTKAFLVFGVVAPLVAIVVLWPPTPPPVEQEVAPAAPRAHAARPDPVRSPPAAPPAAESDVARPSGVVEADEVLAYEAIADVADEIHVLRCELTEDYARSDYLDVGSSEFTSWNGRELVALVPAREGRALIKSDEMHPVALLAWQLDDTGAAACEEGPVRYIDIHGRVTGPDGRGLEGVGIMGCGGVATSGGGGEFVMTAVPDHIIGSTCGLAAMTREYGAVLAMVDLDDESDVAEVEVVVGLGHQTHEPQGDEHLRHLSVELDVETLDAARDRAPTPGARARLDRFRAAAVDHEKWLRERGLEEVLDHLRPD